MRPLLFLALALVAASSCTCDGPGEDPPKNDGAGSIRVDVDGPGATLVLVDLAQPLSAVQVDVAVDGGTASAFLPLADHDVVEAGLAPEHGGPKDRFTAVVGDTRRLPLNDGALARLTVDDGARVTLSNAFGVDQTGKKRALTVVTK